MEVAQLAPIVPRIVTIPEWVFMDNHYHTLTARSFDCASGHSRIISYQTFSHTLASFLVQWQIGLLIYEDNLVHLAFRLLDDHPIPCLNLFEFNFIATGLAEGTDGQRWHYMRSFLGNELPMIAMDRGWHSMWSVSREPIGPRVPAGMRSIHEFINLRTGRMEVSFHMNVWQHAISLLNSNMPFNEFDVRTLPVLSVELQLLPADVCIVTADGIIKAHSSKVVTEFPGLLGKEFNAPIRAGIMWGVVKVPFNVVVELVHIMYDCYNVAQVDFNRLLTLATHLNLTELHAKIMQWQINVQALAVQQLQR
ncbi:unnamed protein product [Orchesella dallaii]|uniref:Uncharacterized protein n=1 Tax=Orchesella dallaii TaxID=48710 RepID=A0ABP1R8R0_9HEXA